MTGLTRERRFVVRVPAAKRRVRQAPSRHPCASLVFAQNSYNWHGVLEIKICFAIRLLK
jgi:hypothetical protein